MSSTHSIQRELPNSTKNVQNRKNTLVVQTTDKQSQIGRTRSVPILPSQSQPSNRLVVKTFATPSQIELRSLTDLVRPVTNTDLYRSIVDSFNRNDGYTQQQLKLFVDLTNPDRGYGVQTIVEIARHMLVCEYAGDLLNQTQSKQLEDFYEKAEEGCYMFYFVYKNRHLCVDATNVPDDDAVAESKKYGFGRYINHSRKQPNLIGRIITDSLGQPRLCFFAKKNIKADEELLIDYGDRDRETMKANSWLKD